MVSRAGTPQQQEAAEFWRAKLLQVDIADGAVAGQVVNFATGREPRAANLQAENAALRAKLATLERGVAQFGEAGVGE